MRRSLKWALPAAATAGTAVLAATSVIAQSPTSPQFTPVVTANPKAAGYAPASRLGAGLEQFEWARGSTKLENPEGIIGWYGYENDAPSPDNANLPQMVPGTSYKDAGAANSTEAQKTEPDENTYLVFKNNQSPGGPDANYSYGTHFLFQGHEGAAPLGQGDTGFGKQGYITRVNLDADREHRVTLLATKDDQGRRLATIDGSTYDPFANRLLFTTENASAPTYAATPTFPSTVTDVSGALGRGGYEGIVDDIAGEIWIVEDIGGKTDTPSRQGTTAKRPNSFIYRYVPKTKGDLQNGKLQALQVFNTANQPITFDSQGDLNNPDQQLIHSYGHSLRTVWVTIHDTATDGTAPFNANALAKAKGATPFKRPENGRFRPGTSFQQFFFDETGDTDATSPENATAGGWGDIQKLTQSSADVNTGHLTLFYKGDQTHAGLDNATWLNANQVTFVEDAGDTLHGQRNALDSGWVFDARTDYSKGAQPDRWLAEGRDASATLDSANGGFGKNDSDNEITGAIVSDGDMSPSGILGVKTPNLFKAGWRWFYTQQHGDNQTFEVLPQP